MKKHIPNILLLTIVLVNILFMGMYIRNSGLGMFFKITGIIFLILGVIIFIFFLSIDPGYGWTKSIDLSKNYIMIFASMAVCMAGIVLIVTGQQINDQHEQAIYANQRCMELTAGNAEKIMKRDWYSLRDQQYISPLDVYLFQKKSDRNKYKVIAILDSSHAPQAFTDLMITSSFLSDAIKVKKEQTSCSGVFEQDITIDFEQQQFLKNDIRFNVFITVSGDIVPGTDTVRDGKTMKFTLKNAQQQSEKGPMSNTQTGFQSQMREPDFFTSAFLPGRA